MLTDEGSSDYGEPWFFKIDKEPSLIQIPQRNVIDVKEAVGRAVHSGG